MFTIVCGKIMVRGIVLGFLWSPCLSCMCLDFGLDVSKMEAISWADWRAFGGQRWGRVHDRTLFSIDVRIFRWWSTMGGVGSIKNPIRIDRLALEQDGYIYRDYFSPNLVFIDEELWRMYPKPWRQPPSPWHCGGMPSLAWRLEDEEPEGWHVRFQIPQPQIAPPNNLQEDHKWEEDWSSSSPLVWTWFQTSDTCEGFKKIESGGWILEYKHTSIISLLLSKNIRSIGLQVKH